MEVVSKMWEAMYNWINFSFKMWFAVLTANILILILFLGGYTFCLVVLFLLGLL